MVTMPAAVSFGTVEWTAMLVVKDTADVGTDPDAVAAVGTVTFTPQLLTPLKATAALVSLLPQPVTVSFDVNGLLSVRLIATDDIDLVPSGWTWHVSPNVSGVTIPAFDVSVPAGAVVNLTTVMPLSPSPGVFVGYGGLTTEEVIDTIGATIVATPPLAAVFSDAADTVTLSTAATVNSSDAYLLSRANHTGTQLAGTISDFSEAVQDAVAGALVPGAGATVTYNDAAGTITIGSTGGGLDVEAVQDAVAAALVGVGSVSIVYNDAANTITISSLATVNSTDAYLLARANHTGTQLSSTVSDLTAVTKATASALIEAGTGIAVAVDAVTKIVTVTSTVSVVTNLRGMDDFLVPPGAGAGTTLVLNNAGAVTNLGSPVVVVATGVDVASLGLPPGTVVAFRAAAAPTLRHLLSAGAAGTSVVAATEGYSTASATVKPVYVTDRPPQIPGGTTSIECVPTTINYVEDNTLSAVTLNRRFLFKLVECTGTINFFEVKTATTAISMLVMTAARQIQMKSISANIKLMTTVLTLGTWYRLDLSVGSSAQTLNLYTDNSATLLETSGSVAAGPGVPTIARLGFPLSVNANGRMRFALDDTGSAPLTGPAV